jgi:hypothetical protein
MTKQYKYFLMKAFFLFYCTVALTIGCDSKNGRAIETRTGSFVSMKGVMDELSCYCFNGGYLTTENNEKIPLCFQEEDEIDCKNLSVEGYFEEKNIDTEETNPCPVGKKSVFKVVAFECE